MSVSKKKRVSKKTKQSWRKHVDIQDVEIFLEDQRLEERLGKPVAEKTNEELFTIDTGPTAVQTLTSKQKYRTLLQQHLPKCFSMLQPLSEVPDPIIKRNRVKTKEERKNKLIRMKEEERKRLGILTTKEKQTARNKILYETKRNNELKKTEINTDIWSSDEVSNNDLLKNEWIRNDTKLHTFRSTGKPQTKLRKSVRSKNSTLPADALPHPGTSYNPSFADHQALLQEVAKKEVKIIEEEKHLNRVTRGMFSKVSPTLKEENWLIEMSQGLEKPEPEENENEEYKTVNPPVQNKKKNLKQRRKQKEQQQLEHAKKTIKKEKRKIADIYKLKFLKEQLDKDEKQAEILRLKRLKKKEIKAKEPKRLSSIKFEEQEIDFNMPQDISGNLRNLKKEGNLLVHCFKSLQKRNILQPTTIRTRSRAKVKRFQKPGFKDDWKVTVARSTNTVR